MEIASQKPIMEVEAGGTFTRRVVFPLLDEKNRYLLRGVLTDANRTLEFSYLRSCANRQCENAPGGAFPVAQVEKVRLVTDDGRMLDGVYCRAGMKTEKDATVILTHGNAMTWDGFCPTARFYLEHGVNVLMYTMGGYPGSQGPKGGTTEASTYADQAAAVGYLKSFGIKDEDIIAHGISLGASLAMVTPQLAPGCNLVLEAPMESVTSSAKYILGRICGAIASWTFLKRAFPVGRRVEVLNTRLITDGYDSVQKMEKMKTGEVLVFRLSHDEVIPHDAAEAILQARYGLVREDRLCDLEGFHGGGPMTLACDSSQGREKLTQYLQEIL